MRLTPDQFSILRLRYAHGQVPHSAASFLPLNALIMVDAARAGARPAAAGRPSASAIIPLSSATGSCNVLGAEPLESEPVYSLDATVTHSGVTHRRTLDRPDTPPATSRALLKGLALGLPPPEPPMPKSCFFVRPRTRADANKVRSSLLALAQAPKPFRSGGVMDRARYDPLGGAGSFFWGKPPTSGPAVAPLWRARRSCAQSLWLPSNQGLR